MLYITIPETEFYDEQKGEFVQIKETRLQLEHSLVSVSKWEAKHHKPFLAKEEKTYEESIDYIRCMTITQNVDPIIYYALSEDALGKIRDYLDDSMTATWFNEKQQKQFSREIITSEIIYYWMVSFQIPFECEKWHLSRLLTLIRVCNIKNQPAKKINKRDLVNRNAALNAARRQSLGSRG